MKLLQRRPAAIEQRLIIAKAPIEAPSMKQDPLKPRYTLRVEDGMIQINNISGTPESVTYSLMAQKPDGSTELITKQVSLKPFQVFEDPADGLNVLAAWSKN